MARPKGTPPAVSTCGSVYRSISMLSVEGMAAVMVDPLDPPCPSIENFAN